MHAPCVEALDAFANGWDAAIQLLMQPNSRRSAQPQLFSA